MYLRHMLGLTLLQLDGVQGVALFPLVLQVQVRLPLVHVTGEAVQMHGAAHVDPHRQARGREQAPGHSSEAVDDNLLINKTYLGMTPSRPSGPSRKWKTELWHAWSCATPAAAATALTNAERTPPTSVSKSEAVILICTTAWICLTTVHW